jgi:hypothetical protein
MFTSLLRRLIDARPLALAAALLISGCALHRPDASSLSAPSPASDEPVTLPHIELPDIDIPVPDITLPDVALSEPTTPPITRWVTHAPSYTLVSTSEQAEISANAALRETSLAFERLFGERPSRIAVAVIDTTNRNAELDIPAPPDDMTSIVLVGGGLTGQDSAAAAAALTSDLRFEAAAAWIFDYAQTWCASRIRDKEPMPTRARIAHPVSQREADGAQPIARGPAGSALTPLVTPRDAEWRRGLASAAETTSLMTFLCNERS